MDSQMLNLLCWSKSFFFFLSFYNPFAFLFYILGKFFDILI